MGLDLSIKSVRVEEAKKKLASVNKVQVVGTTENISDENYTVISENIPVNNILLNMKKNVLKHFTPEMLPEPIRRWILDNCMQAEGSLSYGAAAAIMTVGTLIGYSARVKPKVNVDWKIVPNLWGMAIGDPSARKSPVVDQFLKPLYRLEQEAYTAYEAKIKIYLEEKLHHDLASKAQKKALQKAYDNADEKAIEQAKSMKVPYIGEEPIPERFIINDATTEAIGIIASKSERTVLQYRDELAGFFSSFQKPGREGDRAFFLESFQGDRSYSYDRIGRGSIHIKHLSLSLFGTIQPSVLPKYILSKDGASHDGLAQRMQLAVFSDGLFKPYMDEPVDREAKEEAFEIMKVG